MSSTTDIQNYYNEVLAQIGQNTSITHDPDTWGIIYMQATGQQAVPGMWVMGSNANPQMTLDQYWPKLTAYLQNGPAAPTVTVQGSGGNSGGSVTTTSGSTSNTTNTVAGGGPVNTTGTTTTTTTTSTGSPLDFLNASVFGIPVEYLLVGAAALLAFKMLK